MEWREISNSEQLKELDNGSMEKTAIIFKHSTRCGVSMGVKKMLEREWLLKDYELANTYFLDILKCRSISNEIAERYQIEHESPQVLLIKNGKCFYAESHYQATRDNIVQALKQTSD